MLQITDLNAYIYLLNRHATWYDSFRLTIDDTFYKVCKKHLLSDVNKMRFFRCYAVYRFYSHLAKCKIISPIKVKLHPFKQGYAYMLDKGEIHLFSDLLFKSSHAQFIAVLLHESAHVVLSQENIYDSLLQLDIQFAKKYLKDQHNELLKTITPVEFFTQLITYKWFEELIKRSNRPKERDVLNHESQKIHSKLASAVEVFNTINL